MQPMLRQVKVGWLALFALALQLALSFGHIHHHESSAAHLTIAVGTAPHSSSVPASSNDDDDDDDAHCAICWSMTLAGTAILPVPPIVLLPRSVEAMTIRWVAIAITAVARHTSFQPRAPPAECVA